MLRVLPSFLRQSGFSDHLNLHAQPGTLIPRREELAFGRDLILVYIRQTLTDMSTRSPCSWCSQSNGLVRRRRQGQICSHASSGLDKRNSPGSGEKTFCPIPESCVTFVFDVNLIRPGLVSNSTRDSGLIKRHDEEGGALWRLTS